MKYARTLISLVAIVLAAGILYAMLPGCVGAPRSVQDLATMPQDQFASWKNRVMSHSEEGAYEIVHASPGRAGTMHSLASALRGLAGVAHQGEVAALVGDGSEYAGMLRIAMLELGALVDASLADMAAAPRIAELVASVAGAIESGTTRATQ